jgi:hypothetical protein
MKTSRGSQLGIKAKKSSDPSKLDMWSNKSGLDMVNQANAGFTAVDVNNRFKKSELSFNFKGNVDGAD